MGASQKLASQDLGSEFAEVDLATGARKASVVLEVEQYRNTTQWAVVFWLGFWFWLGYLGAVLSRFFVSLAVVGTWGDQPPSGVVRGGPRVTRRCPRRCRADLCPWPVRGGRFFPGGFPQR